MSTPITLAASTPAPKGPSLPMASGFVAGPTKSPVSSSGGDSSRSSPDSNGSDPLLTHDGGEAPSSSGAGGGPLRCSHRGQGRPLLGTPSGCLNPQTAAFDIVTAAAMHNNAALTGIHLIHPPYASSSTTGSNVLGSASSTVSAPVACAPSISAAPVRRKFTLPQMLCLFSVSFSYAFVFNTVMTIVVPKEIERLASTRQSLWVGVVMALGAVCQLATPVVGSLSDRSGQRVSFLIYGTFVAIAGVVVFLMVATMRSLVLLFVAHSVTTLGLSVQYAMVTAMLNDYVCDEQMGKGSGTMAILAVAGSGAGYAMFALEAPLYYSYCSYILACVTCLGITVMAIPPEGMNSSPITKDPPNRSIGNVKPGGVGRANPSSSTSFRHSAAGRLASGSHPSGGASLHATPSGAPASGTHFVPLPPMTCLKQVTHSLSMPSPKKYPDFFYACLGRALFNMGLAGQVFLVYYVRDVLRLPNPVAATSLMAVMALVGSLVGALPAGLLSDRYGKKPVIFVAVAVCILSLLTFLALRTTLQLQLAGLIYGIGNVSYLSVDYALGVQTLPRQHHKHGDPRGGRATTAVGGGNSTDRSGSSSGAGGGGVNGSSTACTTAQLLGAAGGASGNESSESAPLGLPLPALAHAGAGASITMAPTSGGTSSSSGHTMDAAKDLGVFAMSATIGQLVGQIIFGILLDWFAAVNGDMGSLAAPPPGAGGSGSGSLSGAMVSPPHHHIHGGVGSVQYTYAGFVSIFSLSCVCFAASAFVVHFIRSVR